MSIIAVKVNKDKIKIASDSQSTRGFEKENADTKIIQSDDLIVGCVGLTKVRYLLELFLETNKLKDNSEREVARFFNEFDKWLRIETNGSVNFQNNEFLLIKNKKVMYFNNFEIEEVKTFYCIGSGRIWAFTALELGADIEKAIRIACDYSLYCSGAVKLIEIELEKQGET
jgi:ATP-dependent protease HslVU (ClpYQ) peptidase subunit